MDYTQTLNYLFSQLPVYQRDGKAAYKANLNNTHALDEYFGHPHKSFKTIHVAGTNGKGSVSHMLASILQASGLKVGLYTSPHLLDFRERIKINGTCISEDEVVSFVENHKIILEQLKPSFFEMTVAMAFQYFKAQEVDVAIIEVGMGGRLDSTNIITPLVSIITNIGLDHTNFLGDTLAKIAIEKAGIIKPEVPVIIGEYNNETLPVFENAAKRNNCFICFSQRRFKIQALPTTEGKQFLSVKNEQSGTTYNVQLDLLGAYQAKNIIPVFGALQVLIPHFNIPKASIVDGLANVVNNTKLLGRWQIIRKKPLVICDTGHNKEGVENVIAQLKGVENNTLHMVFGSVDDKDIKTILALLPKNAKYYFTQANIPRALCSTKLYKLAKEFSLEGSIFKSVGDAYNTAIETASSNDVIFVGGSTFIVADLLSHLNYTS